MKMFGMSAINARTGSSKGMMADRLDRTDTLTDAFTVHNSWIGIIDIETDVLFLDYVNSNTGDRVLYVGGNWNNTSNAGVANANANNDTSNSNSNIGSRLAYDPYISKTYRLTLDHALSHDKRKTINRKNRLVPKGTVGFEVSRGGGVTS